MAHKRPGYPSVSEDTINLMLKNLRRKHPDATREDVIELIKRYQEVIRDWNLTDPEGLMEFYDQLQLEKELKTN